MRFRILGALEAEADGKLVALGRPPEQRVLAVLLLNSGRPVPVTLLVDAVWDSDPPATAVKQVRNAVSRLRFALGDYGVSCLARTHGGAYRLLVAADALDARVFEDQVAAAMKAADAGLLAEAADLLGSALRLWRGQALTGLGGRVIEAAATALDERRHVARETYYDHMLALGRHQEIVPELSALTAEHPLRERLAGQLMLALYRSGRQADALQAYQRTRNALARDLGIDPGPELRRLHQGILADTVERTGYLPPKDRQVASLVPAVHPHAIPRQLPAPTRHFVGRADALKQLQEALDDTEHTVVITAIGGTAGIGKTALAVYWAHLAAERFPDGQLYVNLRGFDPAGTPVTPAEAIRDFLDALGVPVQRIPASQGAQAALFRSLLAGRRVLLVLDNARDSQQVRPLLPGSAGCLALVTSRARLTGLVAAEGARLLLLNALSQHEARDLLARRLGAERTNADREATDEIIRLCARLPLALSLAAARAAEQPALELGAFAASLRHRSGPDGAAETAVLDALGADDPAIDIRAVFSWSYRGLTSPAARMFRLLGIHPGPDITVPAAASLAAVPPGQARNALAELVHTHLLTEHAPGRYMFHDLLRAYAAELARRADGDDGSRPAVRRMLDHYLHTARDATLRTHPTRDRIELPQPIPGVRPESFASHEEAMAWLEAEQHVLAATAAAAAAAGYDRHCWQLAWAMAHSLDRRGRWQEWAALAEAGLAAARRVPDVEGQARTLLDLGRVCFRLLDHSTARTHLNEAAALFKQLGDDLGQAMAHIVIGHVDISQQRYADARDRATTALRLRLAAGYLAGQGGAEAMLGQAHIGLGDYQKALVHCERALRLHRDVGSRVGEAADWDNLGRIHDQLGQHPEATRCLRRAIALHRALGDQVSQARSLVQLGDVHHAAADSEAATIAWQQAGRIFSDLGLPEAAEVRTRLRSR